MKSKAIRKIHDRATKRLERILPDEDWFLLLNLPPTQGGNKRGHWVPVCVWVPVPRKRKAVRK